jgi:hypothetical protein
MGLPQRGAAGGARRLRVRLQHRGLAIVVVQFLLVWPLGCSHARHLWPPYCSFPKPVCISNPLLHTMLPCSACAGVQRGGLRALAAAEAGCLPAGQCLHHAAAPARGRLRK